MIYVIMIEDKHEDVQVYIYSDKIKTLKLAKEWANKLKEKYGNDEDEDIGEIDLTNNKEGWLYSYSYAESGYISVRERSLDPELSEDRFYIQRIM